MTDLAAPVRTTSFLAPLMVRADLPRATAMAYWAGPHADIVGPCIAGGASEYLQQHFSATDHGFWPATATVGTGIPADWRLDGFAEARFRSVPAMLSIPPHMRPVFLDEQNVFRRVLGHPTLPGGGRWWTTGFDATVGVRLALLVRRRRGVAGAAFRRFLFEDLAGGLRAAGARDLRAYAFAPWSPLLHPTPGVAHDNPADRRYQGLVTAGFDDRAALDAALAGAQVAAIVAAQHTALTAVHAYAIERTVPVIGA